VHIGRYDDYEAVVAAVGEVLDPARLANILLQQWEGDENGGMERFMASCSGALFPASPSPQWQTPSWTCTARGSDRNRHG
jgi:hypothetical protein